MTLIERIKELREQCQMPQRQFAAALEVDTALYCKIEAGEPHARCEQVVLIADKALNIVKQNINIQNDEY